MRLSTSQNDQRPPIAFLLVGIHAKSQQEVAIDAAFIIALFHHYEQLLLSPIVSLGRLFPKYGALYLARYEFNSK